MKLSLKIALQLLALSCITCNSDLLKTNSYKDLGTFDTKLEAQNQALSFISIQYNSLPQNEQYKVLYSYRDAAPGAFNRNALWYHKQSQELALEVDIHSGTACQWAEVSQQVLEQATQSTNGLIKIDSLAKPKQPLAQCL